MTSKARVLADLANAETSPNVIASAVVGSSGTLFFEFGCTGEQTSTGVYEITFDTERAGGDYQLMFGPSGADHVIGYASKSSTGFVVNVKTTAGTLADRQFDFIAVGE